MITIDARCTKPTPCRTSVYRMVGYCLNCKADPILIINTETHSASNVDCPVCGNFHSVKQSRLATDDEIPEALTR